jgi:hypothetical protein
MNKETVEEAANRLSLRVVAYMPNPVINQDAKIGFIDGVKWQKEQEANNAIEFAIWTHKNLWVNINDEPLWYNKSKVYQDKTECLTTQQLYELWKKQK